jgi:hypothetical protein
MRFLYWLGVMWLFFWWGVTRIFCWFGWHKWRRVDEPYKPGSMSERNASGYGIELFMSPMLCLLDSMTAKRRCERCGKEKG